MEETKLEKFTLSFKKKFTNLYKKIECYNLTFLINCSGKSWTDTLKFECEDGHLIDNLTATTLNTRTNQKKHPCKDCYAIIVMENKEAKGYIPMEQRIKEKLEKLGHILIFYDKTTRKVIYHCSCGNDEAKSDSSNILKDGFNSCIQCHNLYRETTHTFEEVKQYFNNEGYELLSLEYRCNTDELIYICKFCSEERTTTWKLFHNEGKRCWTCKVDRCKETCKEKYGYENTFQVPEFKEKSRQTLKEKTGYEYAMQNPESFQKMQESSYSYKQFELPSGRIIKIQGYENYCVELLLSKYLEDEIIPEQEHKLAIEYYKKGDTKISVYHPDFLIKRNKTRNCLIEVKSNYTYDENRDITLRKMNGCIKSGYDAELWIFKKIGRNVILDIKHIFNYDGYEEIHVF